MGLATLVSLKVPLGKSRGLRKFPVAPESMRVVVSMVYFSPCSLMGRRMVLLLVGATSTCLEGEEDVKMTPLFKNPMLF